MSAYDVLFLGSSPNALAGAARLARAGLRALVLEPRAVVGGPVATEEFAPGFFADTGVMSAALDPEIARELDLSIDVLERAGVTALGPALYSLRSASDLPVAFSNAVAALRAIYRTSPPEMPAPSGVDAAALRALGAHLFDLGPRQMHEVLRLLFMSSRDAFGELPLSPAERAVLCGASVRGVSQGPFSPGTLFNFLHQEAIGDGIVRCTARGGLGALSLALAASARAHGAEIRTGVPAPLSVEVDDSVARAVILGDGERIEADHIVSDFDAKATFTQLVRPYELDPEVNRLIRAVRCRGSVARIHLALRGLPIFPGLSEDALSRTLVTAPDVGFFERAWDRAKRGGPLGELALEVTLPTLRDPSLAPAGSHVLSVWAQYVPYGLRDAEGVARRVIEELASFAPGLNEHVVHCHVSLPEDLERRFGLTGGHLYGGEICLAQAFFLRPIPGYPRYASPIGNLHMVGSSAHPGGYSGRSGWNLAESLLDRRSRGAV